MQARRRHYVQAEGWISEQLSPDRIHPAGRVEVENPITRSSMRQLQRASDGLSGTAGHRPFASGSRPGRTWNPIAAWCPNMADLTA